MKNEIQKIELNWIELKISTRKLESCGRGILNSPKAREIWERDKQTWLREADFDWFIAWQSRCRFVHNLPMWCLASSIKLIKPFDLALLNRSLSDLSIGAKTVNWVLSMLTISFTPSAWQSEANCVCLWFTVVLGGKRGVNNVNEVSYLGDID